MRLRFKIIVSTRGRRLKLITHPVTLHLIVLLLAQYRGGYLLELWETPIAAVTSFKQRASTIGCLDIVHFEFVHGVE